MGAEVGSKESRSVLNPVNAEVPALTNERLEQLASCAELAYKLRENVMVVKNTSGEGIVPAVSDEEARQRFPGGWKAPKPYMRVVPQPK